MLPAHVQFFIHQYLPALLLRAALNPIIIILVSAQVQDLTLVELCGVPTGPRRPAVFSILHPGEPRVLLHTELSTLAIRVLIEEDLATHAHVFPLKAVLARRKKNKLVDRGSANISFESLLVRKEELWAEPTGLHWDPQDFGPEHSCFKRFLDLRKKMVFFSCLSATSFTAALV